MENWKNNVTRTLESSDKILSEIFVKYAEASDDDIENINADADFTKFPWNINNKNFVINDSIKRQIQDDANRLCILKRNYKLYLASEENMLHREMLLDSILKIEKIFNTMKNIFPEIKISENLKN